MCGRFGFFFSKTKVEDYYRLDRIPDWPYDGSYNVAPTQRVPIIVYEEKPQMLLAKWGLTPIWAKNDSFSFKTINARAETVATSPVFRSAFKKRRCLVPFNVFYEWQKRGSEKIPYAISVVSRPLASFAGIWEPIEGGVHAMASFSIITTVPNAVMKPIHDRMPVILPRSQELAWISPDLPEKEALEMLKPYDANDMKTWEIGKAVNSPKNNDASIIVPVHTSQRKLL